MIRLPTKSEIEVLRNVRLPRSLSMYCPYMESRSSSSDDPNRIQLKNSIKEAHKKLIINGLSEREVEQTLQPVYDLLGGDEFRNNYKRGLALFMHREFFDYYRLPVQGIDGQVVVGKGFKLKPIMDLVKNNFYYFVLCIGHHGAQLFKGDKYHIKKLKFQKGQVTMEEELNIDEHPRETQLHPVASTALGRNSERQHSQYDVSKVDKDMLTKFFRRIDSRLRKIVKGNNVPLILAGVDYLLPIYRQVNTYPHLHADGIVGNFEHTTVGYIHQSACQIIES